MEQDAQGQCYSYYGTWDVKDKPKRGVEIFMLDEHVKRTVEKEKDKFHKEISNIITNFNKALKSSMERNQEDIKTIKLLMSDLNKFIYQIIDLNGLKKPEIEKVAKKKPKKKVKKKEDYDGYL